MRSKLPGCSSARFLFTVVSLLCVIAAPIFAEPANVRFRCLVLSEEFHSEGAGFGDIDGDGNQDVVSGPFWYAGPEFRQRHRYMPGERFSIKAYSQHFFSFIHDFNDDQRPDILVVGMPGQPARWFENPGVSNANWKQHVAIHDAGNESPTLTDLTGDGKPELICVHAGGFGYAEPNWQKPTEPWKFTPIMQPRGLGVFTHGLGVGDVDGDGRMDVLETSGWHQQGDDPHATFTLQPHKFAQAGGSQMFAYDFDGDGDHDVVSVQNAHAYGLTWFERRGQDADVLWVSHPILTDKPSDNEHGLAISQMHGVALADIDGDGVKDIITGKRFFAHGGGDPGAFELPVLYWFRTIRDRSGGVRFQPHRIHSRVGVGTQLTTGDINQDGRIDIVVGNKLGTFVLLNEAIHAADVVNAAKDTSVTDPPLLPGTSDFAKGVRDIEPQSPEEEMANFVLPEGYQAQLVAAEPDIAKPLNMAFDAKGRLWVTCTLEYPYPVEVGTPGRDSIKILEDTDGDGSADKIVTFADGLNIPIGLYPYRDGVICCSIPNIWFLRDTNGDGKCDKREVLYGPFDHTRDTHGMCNAFTRGFDGWLYACHGFNNQSEVAGKDGHRVSMSSGNTFRFRLDGSRIEHFTHGQVNPFGLALDSRGDMLTADCHTKPVTLLMRGGYYDSFGKPHDGLGYVPNVMEHLHGSTAIGGIAITHAVPDQPAAYQHNAFGGNVMTSRVNRNSLIYDEASVRAQEEPDFLISSDSWFRPVDLQIGPDGALYIADFYNRIIGHYEVPLTHPQRDRHRGRIWKISYAGSTSRRDVSKATSSTNSNTNGALATRGNRIKTQDLTTLDAKGLVGVFESPNPTLRMLAADRLVDELGVSAADSVRLALDDALPQVRLHALWVLFRLDQLRASDIEQASLANSHPNDVLLRTHVQRIIGELTPSTMFDRGQIAQWLKRGLSDEAAIVSRAAATACSHHRLPELVSPLLDRIDRTPTSDVHLRHAIRIALRDVLQDESIFKSVAKSKVNVANPKRVSLLAGICLALPNASAADFVVEHLEALAADDKAKLTEFMTYAARYVSPDSVAKVASLARAQFQKDPEFQLQLLNSVGAGFKGRQTETPELLTEWAIEMAERLLHFDQSTSPLGWTHMPHSGAEQTSDSQPTWSLSTRRSSADNGAVTSLWSSFPNGEVRTGIYRSDVFKLGESFEFFLAGHDGYPAEALQQRNFVRIRDAVSHLVLRTWSPPRNDVAQLQRWRSREASGRNVYVELVDGDSSAAYAWLAAGRFSEPGLNPNRLLEDRQVGVELVSDFQLEPLRPRLVELMNRASTDPHTRTLMADAMVSLRPNALSKAIAATMRVANLPAELGQEAAEFVASDAHDEDLCVSLVRRAMKFATTVEQQAIAEQFATDENGVTTLLRLTDAGQLDPRLLMLPNIQSKWNVIATSAQKDWIAEVTKRLPREDASVGEMIRTRIAAFLEHGGDASLGRGVFEKQCATCHQVNGHGKQVGPNLDGLGNRGLERIAEDVLAPNRNVDVAFRATTLVTDTGQAITGLLKHVDGTQLRLVDTTGKEVQISADSVEDQTTSTLSPMPANFRDVLDDEQFRALLSYLLSLTK